MSAAWPNSFRSSKPKPGCSDGHSSSGRAHQRRPSGRHRQGALPRPRSSAATCTCSSPATTAKAAAEAAAKLTGVAKVLHRRRAASGARPRRRDGGAHRVADRRTTTSSSRRRRRRARTSRRASPPLLDVMQISDITKVVSPDTFERPIYAGNAIQTVQSPEAKKVITVRISAFAVGRPRAARRRSRASPRRPRSACRRSRRPS